MKIKNPMTSATDILTYAQSLRDFGKTYKTIPRLIKPHLTKFYLSIVTTLPPEVLDSISKDLCNASFLDKVYAGEPLPPLSEFKHTIMHYFQQSRTMDKCLDEEAKREFADLHDRSYFLIYGHEPDNMKYIDLHNHMYLRLLAAKHLIAHNIRQSLLTFEIVA